MDCSQILCQQSQDKIRCDFQRSNNEQNKSQADPKLFKCAQTHLSKKDSENKDPTDWVQKPLLQPGVSRLPVLAKSLRLQTSSQFKQSHIEWEEKPLAGKAKKKKPCTRPVPFNFSQSRSTTKATENHKLLSVSHSKTPNISSGTNTCSSNPRKHQVASSRNVDSNKGTRKSPEKTTEIESQLSGQSGPINPLKTSATLNQPLRSNVGNMMQNEGASARPAPGAEISLDSMKLLSLKETSKSSSVDQTLTTQGKSVKALNEKGENFQPDHAALLSILRNQGVGFTGQAPVTKKSSLYNDLPQRVPVTKSRQKAGPAEDHTGSLWTVQFSPDPGALKSILQNKGVKPGGTVSATPRTSVCPSNRGTSIYSAQRVPLKKTNTQATGGSVAIKGTPLQKWTPQRVRNTKHLPMSAMSLSGISGKIRLQPRHEVKRSQIHNQEVVQRLFDEPEDEQRTSGPDKDTETHTEKLPHQASSNKPLCEENIDRSRPYSDDDDEEEQKTLIPALPRESVIFFSTGKKLLRVQQFENHEVPVESHQPGLVSSEQRNVSAAHEPTCNINTPVLCLQKDLVTQKTCSLRPAVAMLRKRLPALEELRLDEEVATYTSVSVHDIPGFLHPRPRCGNPLASILHFEESTRFVPIGFDLSSGPSPLHMR